MSNMNRFDGLLAGLQDFRSSNVFNPWGECDPLDITPLAARERLSRLVRHLDVQPLFILVGEAPGHLGCRFSGVPFTDEELIFNGKIPRMTGVGRLTTCPFPFRETSSRRMWDALHELGIADQVILWNAFAWHPHNPGQPYSNRSPSGAELEAGLAVLRELLAGFPGVPTIPVGRIAEGTLRRLGVKAQPALLHPSRRKTEFQRGLRQVIGNDTGERRPA
jgi:hypothetical protein